MACYSSKSIHISFSSLTPIHQPTKYNIVLTTPKNTKKDEQTKRQTPPPSPSNPHHKPQKRRLLPQQNPHRPLLHRHHHLHPSLPTPSLPIGSTNPCGHPPNVACTRLIAAGTPTPTTPGIPGNSTFLPKNAHVFTAKFHAGLGSNTTANGATSRAFANSAARVSTNCSSTASLAAAMASATASSARGSWVARWRTSASGRVVVAVTTVLLKWWRIWSARAGEEGWGDEGEEAGAGDGEGSGGVGLREAGRGGGEVLHLWTGGEEGGKVLGEETDGLGEVQLEAGFPCMGGGGHADRGCELARSGPQELQELGHAGSVTVGVVEVNEHDEAGLRGPEAQLDSSHGSLGVAGVKTREAKTCIKKA